MCSMNCIQLSVLSQIDFVSTIGKPDGATYRKVQVFVDEIFSVS